MHLATFITLLTMYTIQAPNGVCITLSLILYGFVQAANFVETEIVLTIFYTFYCCYKLYSILSEEAIQKLFWRLIAVVVGVIIILITNRALILVLQEASYETPAGYCIAPSDMYKAAPNAQYFGIALYTSTVITQIVFSVCCGILLYTLSKNNNSSQADSSHKCLLKIAAIMSSVSLTSGVVYTLVLYYLLGDYSILISGCVGMCERCTILFMLLNKDDMKKFCKCI